MKAKKFLMTIIAAAMITSAMSVSAFALDEGVTNSSFDFTDFEEETSSVSNEEGENTSADEGTSDSDNSDAISNGEKTEGDIEKTEETADEAAEGTIYDGVKEKASPDTGIADAGMVMAGVAILAGGACIIATKKQK